MEFNTYKKTQLTMKAQNFLNNKTSNKMGTNKYKSKELSN